MLAGAREQIPVVDHDAEFGVSGEPMTRPISVINGSEHPQDQSPQDTPRRSGQAEEQQQQGGAA